MKIIAFDPSSTCIGYAYGTEKEILGASRYVPPGGKAIGRIEQCVDFVYEMLDSAKPDTAIIEISSGKVHARAKHGGGAGLAVYGMAAGAIWATCYLHPQVDEIIGITETEWIGDLPGGMKRKAYRGLLARGLWPPYQEMETIDKGQDIADAILLFNWYVRRKLVTSD